MANQQLVNLICKLFAYHSLSNFLDKSVIPKTERQRVWELQSKFVNMFKMFTKMLKGLFDNVISMGICVYHIKIQFAVLKAKANIKIEVKIEGESNASTILPFWGNSRGM